MFVKECKCLCHVGITGQCSAYGTESLCYHDKTLVFVKDTCLIHRLQQCRCLLLVLLFATLQSQAQQASAPKTQIIHAGKLLDVRTGHIAADAYITVTSDRIASISMSPPAAGTTGDTPVIDMSHYTIVPGLIDAHGHILSDPTTQSSTSYLITSAPQATVRGVANLQLWLKHGFTVVRDACEPYASYPQFALREGLRRSSSRARALSLQAVVYRSPGATAILIVFPRTSPLCASLTR